MAGPSVRSELIRWPGLQSGEGHVIQHDAARKFALSTNLIQLWLTQYDRGELSTEEAEALVIAEHEAKIAALERKVGQLTMELDLVKKRRACAP